MSHWTVRFLKAVGLSYLDDVRRERSAFARRAPTRESLQLVDEKLGRYEEFVRTGVFADATPLPISTLDAQAETKLAVQDSGTGFRGGDDAERSVRTEAVKKEVISMRTTAVILGLLTAAGCCCPSQGDDSEASYYLDVDAVEVSSEDLEEIQREDGPFYLVDVTILRMGPDGSARAISKPKIVCERGKKSYIVVGDGRRIEGQSDLPSNGLRVEAIVGGEGQPDRAVVDAAITKSGSRIWTKTVAVPVVGL